MNKFHIPADQMGKMANPDAILRAADKIPADVLAFLRDAMGTAINHGFILSVFTAGFGLLIAFFVGSARMQAKRDAEASAGNVA